MPWAEPDPQVEKDTEKFPLSEFLAPLRTFHGYPQEAATGLFDPSYPCSPPIPTSRPWPCGNHALHLSKKSSQGGPGCESAGEEQDPHALGFLPPSVEQELALAFLQFPPTQVLLLGVRDALWRNCPHFRGHKTP